MYKIDVTGWIVVPTYSFRYGKRGKDMFKAPNGAHYFLHELKPDWQKAIKLRFKIK